MINADAVEDTLYTQLMALTKEGEAFYYQDYGDYRVFSYRLASYTDFLKPSALEARGSMFYLAQSEKPKLVCRPFKKFFNRNENPFTMGLDLSKVVRWDVKEDGSIITSFIDQVTKKLRVKSKQSLVSEQARMATAFLDKSENSTLRHETESLTANGYTVMFELVGPTNRIVLEYPKTELRVIGVRGVIEGDLLTKEELKDDYPTLCSIWCKQLPPDEVNAESISDMTGIEGFVGIMEDGLMFKDKTLWYKTLHNLKESIETPRRLFDAIIDECIDDAKSMFSTDPFTLDRISKMEAQVIPVYNKMIAFVEKFYEDNKALSRKEYAIKGQAETAGLFNLVMGKYTGKGLSYKDFAKKYMEEIFGISTTDDLLETKS